MQGADYGRLKTELGEGRLKKLYILYGDEDFLKKALVKKMISVAEKNSGQALERIKFEKGFTAGDLSLALNTVSFFGNGKFITCFNTEIFKGNSKRTEFEAVLGAIPSGCHVVFTESSVDKRNPLFVEVSKAGFSYSIDMRKSGDIARYIAGRFKKQNKKISYEDINLFIEYSGSSLTDIEADIEKILLYMGDEKVVKSDYISKLCSGTRQYRLYEMTDYIFSRDASNSLRLLNDLLTDKTPVQLMLAALHNKLKELAEVKEAAEKGRETAVYRNGRPLADFVVRRLKKQASNYSLGSLRNLLLRTAQTDIDIKAGKINDRTAIEILINELCTL